ncbi:diguanylate cyclase [Candidatus Woesearchaeota archaeon]|nr:diguanylate cyclase [Candidatus Woesearchaeota archaeon]
MIMENSIDLSTWKKLQDRAAARIGKPLIMIGKSGEEIHVSGKFPFFLELVRQKNIDMFKGIRLNNLRDNESIVRYGFYGLENIMIPLIADGKKIGAVICEGIRQVDDENFDMLARRTGLEEEELKDSFNSIEKSSPEKYEPYLEMLVDIGLDYSYNNRLNKIEVSKLNVLYKIIEMANSTLELNKVLDYVMNFMVKSLDAGNCSVVIFGEEEKRYKFKDEPIDKDIEKNVIDKAVEKEKTIVLDDIKKRIRKDSSNRYNSMITIPLKMREDITGAINIYGDNAAYISRDDLQFLSMIAEHVSVAVANARHYEEMKELAVIDKLTGMYTRRHFMELLEREVKRSESFEKPISLVLIDIDDFGHYNNLNGHPAGDRLLKDISSVISDNLRSVDVLGRYGGEEFIIMLPEAKSIPANEVAERLRKKIEEYPFDNREKQPNKKVTVSIGLVTCMEKKLKTSDMIKEADESLYKAKRNGKNKLVSTVVIADNLKADVFSR